MKHYDVYFLMPFGATIVLHMIQDCKHKTEEQFKNDINLVELSLHAEFLYMEERNSNG